MTVMSAHADTLCDHFRRYVQAPFEPGISPDGLPDRWVELHWVGFWLDFDRGFGKTCVHTQDTESGDLCTWLLKHSSTEFPDTLPFGILECYGYSFRAEASTSWSQWKAQISITVEIVTDRFRTVALDVDFTGWKSETGAIRLSVYADEDSPWEDRPPLAPLPDREQSTRSDGPSQ